MKKLLSEINYTLSKIVNLLEHLVRMTAKSSERPLAWLAKENCPEAEQLRAEDPERYDYAMYRFFEFSQIGFVHSTAQIRFSP